MHLLSMTISRLHLNYGNRIALLNEVITLVLESSKILHAYKGDANITRISSKVILDKLHEMSDMLSKWLLEYAGSSFGHSDVGWFPLSVEREIEVITIIFTP